MSTKHSFTALLLFLSIVLNAQDFTFPEKAKNYVTDDAKILTTFDRSRLNVKLKKIDDSSSVQIFVYIAKSLDGNEMATLCQRIFHTWKIGKKGSNNGVLIALFIDDHKFRIHTGYGMEGVLPDLLTKKIETEWMRDYFKKSEYYNGLNSGIEKIVHYASVKNILEEFTPEKKIKKTVQEHDKSIFEKIDTSIIVTIVILMLFNLGMFIEFIYNGFISPNKKHTDITLGTIFLVILCFCCVAIPLLGAILIKALSGDKGYDKSDT
jgi:uncharacterized membrane protein YgcG